MSVDKKHPYHPIDELEMGNLAFSSSDPFSDRFRLDDHPPLSYQPYQPYQPHAPNPPIEATTRATVANGPPHPARVIIDHKRCECCRCGWSKYTVMCWGFFIAGFIVLGIFLLITVVNSSVKKRLGLDNYKHPNAPDPYSSS